MASEHKERQTSLPKERAETSVLEDSDNIDYLTFLNFDCYYGNKQRT